MLPSKMNLNFDFYYCSASEKIQKKTNNTQKKATYICHMSLKIIMIVLMTVHHLVLFFLHFSCCKCHSYKSGTSGNG